MLDSFDRIGFLMAVNNGAVGVRHLPFSPSWREWNYSRLLATRRKCAAFAKQVDINRRANNPNQADGKKAKEEEDVEAR